MAQLKDTLVQGSLRVTDKIYSDTIYLKSIFAPTTSDGNTLSAGTNGYTLKTNGSSVYWAADDNNTYTLSDLGGVGTVSASGTSPLTLSASKSGTTVTITGSIGTVPVTKGGTGATTAADARTNLGLGSMATETASNYISKSIGTTKGDIIYWSAAGTPVRLGIGSTGHFLKATANGPAYSALTKSEVTTALGYTPPTTNTTYSAGTGLSLSGTSFSVNTSTLYWADENITTSKSYKTTPEVATIKINGNTSASAASTSNVTLVYNTTTKALDFNFV